MATSDSKNQTEECPSDCGCNPLTGCQKIPAEETGLYRSGSHCGFIETRLGFLFDLENPDPLHIQISDIASHTSKLCRFNGATCKFYSVAEHCYLAWLEAVKDHGHGPVAHAVLLHDAVEAYTGDVTRPLKRLCPDYAVVESRVNSVVLKALGVDQSPETQRRVRYYDNIMARAEAHYLMASRGRDWDWRETPLLEHITPYCWKPEIAEGRFRNAFRKEAGA